MVGTSTGSIEIALFNKPKLETNKAAFVATNPTLLRLIYPRKLYPGHPTLVVSLGSGIVLFNRDPQDIGTEGLAYALGN